MSKPLQRELEDLRSYFHDPKGILEVSFDGQTYTVTWYRSRDLRVPWEHSSVCEHSQVSIEEAIVSLKVTAWTLRRQDLFNWPLGANVG